MMNGIRDIVRAVSVVGPARAHLIVFGICTAMLCAAAILTPSKEDSPGLALSGYKLPPMCMMKMQTGLDCPGCGLTRSWVAAAHGDMQSSLGFHRMGWLLMLYTALQALRHGVWLFFDPTRSWIDKRGPWLDRALIPLAILLFVNWGIEFL